MRRNFNDVLSAMMEKIPEHKVDLIEDLNWNIKDGNYKAPEQNIHWIRTRNTMLKHFPSPKEDWEFEVLSIFTNVSIEELRIAVDKDNSK